jgi:hypothetical protein
LLVPAAHCLAVLKLGYFLERYVDKLGLKNAMGFQFGANKYGPYSERLKHLLNGLGRSCLHCDKRIGDAGPFDIIRFDDSKRAKVSAYFTTAEAKPYRVALEATSRLIDGFESSLGMELLATVDWMLSKQSVEPTLGAIRQRLSSWPGGKAAGQRKLKLFEDRTIEIALSSLDEAGYLGLCCALEVENQFFAKRHARNFRPIGHRRIPNLLAARAGPPSARMVCLSSMRQSRHWLRRTPMACFGVWWN